MARIVGVDIEPRAATLATPDVEIVIGDQADPAFLARLARELGRIDVLIDDGGHMRSSSDLPAPVSRDRADGVPGRGPAHELLAEFGGGLRASGCSSSTRRGSSTSSTPAHPRTLRAAKSEVARSTWFGQLHDSNVFEKRPKAPPEARLTGRMSFLRSTNSMTAAVAQRAVPVRQRTAP
jgi:hypothetical protein